jgi:vancomycin resistance protein YoaR
MKKLLHYFFILLFIASVGCSNRPHQPVPETPTPVQFQKQSQESSVPDNLPKITESPALPPAVLVPDIQPSVSPSRPTSPIKKTKPKVKPIGSFSTPLLNRDKDRVNNIRLAIKKINGHKLDPGETFSFNDTVGKRDAENGFKMAAIIINGEYGEDMGGGVCQLSSTIFNAAERANLDIIERHSHTRMVKYVPPSKDAAVSYPYLDFRFTNNKNYPIKISATISGKRVVVSIWKAKFSE